MVLFVRSEVFKRHLVDQKGIHEDQKNLIKDEKVFESLYICPGICMGEY